MSSKKTTFEQMKLAMDEGEPEGKTITELAAMYFSKSNTSSYNAQMVDNLYEEASRLANDFGNFGEELEMESFYEFCDAKQVGEDESPTSEEEARFEGLMNNDDMEVSEMYCQVIHLAHKLCSSYTIFCPHCMTAGHFSFQCSHTYNESLVSYENGDATSEVLEYVLYKGAHELQRKIMVLMMSEDSFSLEMAYETTQYIADYCQKHFSGNALVIKSKEICKTIVSETNILQEPHDNKEEHQKGEVEDKHHTTNNEFVYDASISSNDSYCV